ncbi:hypothetical protein M514_15551 [Trichuris suis]|uniref:Uncharacterized protein n=1 Tax=Trichuris suis TaxID=68888 RepID=A0A085NS32_9BILA|nr:hypothetical protein M514_15551 [Trichuris suis]
MLLNITYITFLLLLGGTTVLTRYDVWHPEKLETVQLISKVKNAIKFDGTSRSKINYTEVKHQWIIEHFREQEELQKLTRIPIQSAEFSPSDNRHKFRMSFQGRDRNTHWSSPRTLVLHSLADSDSLFCKVRLDILSTSHRYETFRNISEKIIHVNKTREFTQIARVTLPSLEGYIDNNGALTFLCTITIFGQASTVRDNATTTQKENSEPFVDSFKRILGA